ncbi:MAG: hypothetical protein KDB53_12500, partial [Planctomycetes bacterium]|nr:hypothetical protein [Planctomycetota bacterium]
MSRLTCPSVAIAFLMATAIGFAQNLPEIHYLQFNEGVGTTTADLAAPGLSGSAPTLSGTASWNTTNPQLGNAALTTGATATDVCNTNTVFSVTGDWTVECWLFDNSAAGGTFGYFFGDSSATNFRAFANGAAGTGNVVIAGGGLPNTIVAGGAPGPGLWTHVGWVYDSVAQTLTPYLNGVGQTPTTGVNVPSIIGSSPTGLKIGGHTGVYQGSVDEFRFWNQARSAADMLNSYSVELGGMLAPIDMRLASVDSPNDPPGSCSGLSAAEIVSFTAQNFGANVLPVGTMFTAGYTADGGVTTVMESFTSTTALNTFATESFSFATPLDLSIPAAYTIDVVVSLAGDTNSANDTRSKTVNAAGAGGVPVTSYPFNENFDNFGATLQSTTPPPGWEQDPTDAVGTDSDWYFRNTSTSSTNTGPSSDHTTGVSGAGFYAYVEDSTGNFSMVNLRTPCLDFGALSNPSLSFWMHSNDANGGTNQNPLSVDVLDYTTNTTVMDVLGPINQFGDMLWHQQVVDLSAFAGHLVQIQFRGRSDGGSFTNDVAIDDVSVFNAQPSNGQAPLPGLASMDISNATNGGGFPVSSGANGIYFATINVGGSIDFDFEGEPGQAIILLAGASNEALVNLPPVGQFDIGTGIGGSGIPTGLSLVADGTQVTFPSFLFRTDAAGSAVASFSVPSFPLGVLTSFQAVFFTPSTGTVV